MDLEVTLPKRRRTRSVEHLPLHFVAPGEIVTTEPGFLRGHGTFLEDDKLVASVSGVVERVNKLVSVRPLRARYTGEVGDVVVGRVVAVGNKRWKVDINGSQEAVLLLSSIILPGGVQRRRTYEDALQMRGFFQENDLISAEVQSFFADGSVSLHTRSLKYGKLEHGQLVCVHPALIRRLKQHFHSLPCGVDVILGNNGYIFLAETGEKVEENAPAQYPITNEGRERVCRVRNAIVALASEFLPITPESIMQAFEAARPYSTKTILTRDSLSMITREKRV